MLSVEAISRPRIDTVGISEGLSSRAPHHDRARECRGRAPMRCSLCPGCRPWWSGVMRASWAMEPMARASAGRIRCRSASTKRTKRPASSESTVISPVTRGGTGVCSLSRPMIGNQLRANRRGARRGWQRRKRASRCRHRRRCAPHCRSRCLCSGRKARPGRCRRPPTAGRENRPARARPGRNSLISLVTERWVTSERPKSPCTRIAQPVEVLHGHRLVEVHLLAQPVHHPLRRTRADGHARRVAGHDAGDDEDDDRQAQQHEDGVQETTGKETRQWTWPVNLLCRFAACW